MSAPLSEQRLAEIRARVEAATAGPWCTDDWEIYQGAEYMPGLSTWVGETCRALDHEGARADAAFIAAAREDVPALLAEVARLREHFGKALAGFNAQSLRVTALEAERHSTNEALNSAASEAAALVAEYRVPTANGRWLSVRRASASDRWSIVQTFGNAPMSVWAGDRWTPWGLARDEELWAYDSADAALAEATRLAEAGEPR